MAAEQGGEQARSDNADHSVVFRHAPGGPPPGRLDLLTGVALSLTFTKMVRLGRTPGFEFSIPADNAISGLHATIGPQSSGWYLCHISKTNPTTVHAGATTLVLRPGVAPSIVRLESGCELEIGGSRLRFTTVLDRALNHEKTVRVEP